MNNIPELTPNVNMAQGAFDEPIRLGSINVTDINVTQPANCGIDSMAPNSVETIGDIKVSL
jgi:hypothetical protein